MVESEIAPYVDSRTLIVAPGTLLTAVSVAVSIVASRSSAEEAVGAVQATSMSKAAAARGCRNLPTTCEGCVVVTGWSNPRTGASE
jgi:hypothetical protein